MAILCVPDEGLDLAGAEQALAAGAVAEAERPAVHLKLCRAYMALPEPDWLRAREHGEQAAALAEARGASAVHAAALVCLGLCHAHLRRFDEAIRFLQRFEALLPGLGPEAEALAGEGRLQLGLALARRGDRAGARAALGRARAWFAQRGEDARAEECRRHLVQLLLEDGEWAALPPLLAEGEQYLAANPGDDTARWSHHLQQGEYALATGDPLQAVRAANAALQAAGSDPVRCYACYMLLMRCAQCQSHHREAMNFALSARVMALDAHRYDLDFQATFAFIELFRSLGESAGRLLQELDQEYQQRGLDMYRYLPESLLRRGE